MYRYIAIDEANGKSNTFTVKSVTQTDCVGVTEQHYISSQNTHYLTA